jgi:phosphoglycerate dehydrogenase-like enzyme
MPERKRIIVTGTPLADRYVAQIMALDDYEVVNGTREVITLLNPEETDLERDLTEDELALALEETSVYIYGGLEPASERALRSANRLELIAFLGTGWADPGCVDQNAARELGLRVSNTPHANAYSTAEMTICLMLALERALIPMKEAMRRGAWAPLQRQDLRSRTLGIIGLGHVGSTVARIASQGLGMRVTYFGPHRKYTLEEELDVEFVQLPALCAGADYLSVHSPAVETLGLISEELVALMKADASLINSSSPEIVNGQALLSALKSERLRGLAMDGNYQDPTLAQEFRALSETKIILTPRAAWLTKDSYNRMSSMALESITDHRQGSYPVRWQVLGS